MKIARKILWLIPLLIVISLLVWFSCGKKKSSESSLDNWTILVYSDGNNDLDISQGNTSYVIEDVQEMESVGSSDKVNVIAMVSSIRTGGQANYYHIEHYPDDLGDDLSSTILDDLGSKDMSNYQTLRDFLVYGVTNYPAENYMVVIDDHGAGWPGSCVDDQNGSGSLMSMVSMKNAFTGALTSTGIGKFDIITFHCCLMSMVEVAYQLRNCADYMVASEFVMPMESVFGCDEWLGDLVDSPGTSPRDLAKAIVTAVDNSGRDKQKYVHMAATDLSQMAHLASKVDHLGIQLRTTATEYWWEVYQAWFSCWNTDYDAPAYIDLRDFANNLSQQDNLQNINVVINAVDSVISAINATVIMTKTNAPVVTRGGLTIHMPYLMEMYDSTDYARLDFQDVGWTNFLSIYIHGLEPFLGSSLTVNISPAAGGTVNVSPEQQSYAQGDTVTLQAVPANGYVFDHWSISGNSYDANPISIIFGSNDVTVTAYFTEEGGGTTVTVSGTITWPGHALTHPYAFLDTSHTEYIYGVLFTPANTGNGTYTMQFDLTGNLDAYIEGWDDLNNNGVMDSGEPIGYFDANQNESWDDMLVIEPGQTITNANIELFIIGIADSPFREKGILVVDLR
jgi:hypothetical protein